NPLRSILLSVSSLITSEEIETDQIRDKDLFFMTETLRVSVYTCKLSPVPSRCNLKATMVPGGPLNRRTRRTVGRLTGGRRVDMKDESHKVCAFSSHEYCPWCPPYTTLSRGGPHPRCPVVMRCGFLLSLPVKTHQESTPSCLAEYTAQ